MRRIVAEEPQENARRRRVAPPAACSVSMWKNTASPGSSSHARISNPSRFASMSGSSASEPSGNHFACWSMNVRGISHGPRCDPATNSTVDSRSTGSTGIHIEQFWKPSTL